MRHLTLLGSLVIISSSAVGCELDAPTARLPGYSDEQADARAMQMWSDWAIISHYERTEALLKKAPIIYLAKVEATEEIDKIHIARTTILPVQNIKGSSPRTSQIIDGYLPTSCGTASGDGDGAYAKPGELIIVFQGVSRAELRPNGIDSVRVNEVRNVELLDKVQEWLEAQPGYKPYD